MAELCHRGRLLDTTTLHRERTREKFVQKLGGGQAPKTKSGQKMGGPATTQPSPPLSDGDSQPQGRRWCRCSQSCEIATLPPTSPLLPPHHPTFSKTNLTPNAAAFALGKDATPPLRPAQPKSEYADIN